MAENSTLFQDAVTINSTGGTTLIVKGGLKIEGSATLSGNVTAGNVSAQILDAQQYFVNGSPLPGANAQYAQLLTETGTTSASYVVRWTHTMNSVPAGQFMVMCYYECRASGSGRSCDVQILLDNVTVLHQVSNAIVTANTEIKPVTVFSMCTFPTTGSHTITFLYKHGTQTTTAYLGNLRIQTWQLK
ncbi:hypothetical protein HK102_003724 [Quaeritorhiza haematococci]|nr:hypothetical protein HK102_003724 [Quaeritorhiza haematococci]